MSVLTIPETGLQLDSSPSSRDFLPMQAFGITLNDSVIEDMIKCVQRGQEIELTLGNNPSFLVDLREHPVSPETDGYDLYITNPDESMTKAQRLPNPTMSILAKPNFSSGQVKRTDKAGKSNKQASRASSSGIESDGDGVAGSYARVEAQKSSNAAKIVNGIPRNAKRGAKNKPITAGRSAMSTVLSSNNQIRSLPTSPALNGISSPNPGFSASQQVLEKNKGQRSILVHELAVRDQPFEHLQDVWMGPDADLKSTLEKVASFDSASNKWNLRKTYWKELDVWKYDYDSPADRQAAIDNAIKQYDKQRLGTSDPVWERLLSKDDRGKGRVLSKLQATLAKGNITPAPKISVSKAEDGNKSDVDSSKAKGEAMARSSSQPVGNKSKKVSDREAQAKRLLSNNPKKPAPKKPTSKVKAAEEKGKRVLSEEFVYDSDSSDEAPLAQDAPPAPPAPKASSVQRPTPTAKTTKDPVKKVAEKVKATSAPPPAPAVKPKPKPVVRAPRAPVKAPASISSSSSQKRAREDDESSSSSGVPLSKRIKPKDPPKPLPKPPAVKPRPSDANQTSRNTSKTAPSNFSAKTKNNSPAKSSPLASSPPANASDIDEKPRPRPSARPQQDHQDRPRNGDREGDRDRDRPRGNGHMTNDSSTSLSTISSSSSSSVTGLTNNANGIKKRKDEQRAYHDQSSSQQSTPSKRPRVSKDVLIQARSFTRFYAVYESLHHEIAALKDPPDDKLENLLEMRERLANMKNDIARAVAQGA